MSPKALLLVARDVAVAVLLCYAVPVLVACFVTWDTSLLDPGTWTKQARLAWLLPTTFIAAGVTLISLEHRRHD